MATSSNKLLLNRWPKIIGILLVIFAVAGIGIVLGARHVYQTNLRPVAANQKSVTVTIPLGSSLGDIAGILKRAGVIKSDWAFSQYVRNKRAGGIIKAGTYELSPSQSVSEIVAIITEGRVATNLITIYPGQRIDQVRKTFIGSGFLAKAVDKALNPSLYATHPALVDKPAGASLEGYLYPESFQKTADTKPEHIIRLSLDEMSRRLTPETRAAITSQGLPIYDSVILASMAEKEADKLSDRQLIVGIFLNRLRRGLRLESDPTAFYGAAINNQPLSLNYDTPYNTYLHAGLPPGPISNVTAASIQAVASPTASDYLYFVAGDDETVHFSKTLAEHQDKVSKYCHEKCQIPVD